MNWPVNDVDNGKNFHRLFMGKGEMYQKGTQHLAGVVTNPMQEAQASKNALFATADFCWNSTDFDADQSWADGWKYIEPDAAEDLHEIAKHLSDAAPNGLRLEESEELKPILQAYSQALANGGDLESSGNEVIKEFDKIIKAADGFMEKSKNEELKKEMEPFLLALKERLTAAEYSIRGQLAIQDKDKGAIWEAFSQEGKSYQQSLSHRCETFDGSAPSRKKTLTVRVSTGFLEGFVDQLHTKFQTDAKKALGISEATGGDQPSTAVVIHSSNFGYYSNYKWANLIDGNENTFVWTNQVAKANDYIGLDLGEIKEIGKIHLTMGATNGGSDHFNKYTIKGSNDQTNWEALSSQITQNAAKKTTDLDLTGQGKRYRYVVVMNDEATSSWTKVSEFKVDPVVNQSLEPYTNAEALKAIIPTEGLSQARLASAEAISLQPGEYIGIKLTRIKTLTGAEPLSAGGLSLETSLNGEEFTTVTSADQLGDARYVRFMNKGKEAVQLTLNPLRLTTADQPNALVYREAVSSQEAVDTADLNKVCDGNLATSFQPPAGEGSLTYRLSEGLDQYKSLVIYSGSPSAAQPTLSIRTGQDQWQDLGSLTKSYRVVDLRPYKKIYEVKISWPAGHAFSLSEIQLSPDVILEKPALDFSRLEETIAQAQALKNSTAYSGEAKEKLEPALTEALKVAMDPETRQRLITSAQKTLEEAILQAMKVDGHTKEVEGDPVPLDMTGAVVVDADSEYPDLDAGKKELKENALDGRLDTFWHND